MGVTRADSRERARGTASMTAWLLAGVVLAAVVLVFFLVLDLVTPRQWPE